MKLFSLLLISTLATRDGAKRLKNKVD